MNIGFSSSMKNITFTIIFLLFLTSNYSFAQRWAWALQQKAEHMAVDSAGNLFFNKGTELNYLNTDGQFIWNKQFMGDLSIRGLAADYKGNVYVTGVFTNFIYDGNVFIAKDSTDVFLAKLNNQGQLLWSNIIGGPHNDYVNDIQITEEQKLLLCGTLGKGEVIDYERTDTTQLFVGRYNLEGNLELWIKGIGGQGWEVASNSSGEIYVLGNFTKSTVDFGNGTVIEGFVYDQYGDHFIVKFSREGAGIWSKNLGSMYYSPFENLGVEEDGNYYLTRWNRYDGFSLYKYNSLGESLWKGDFPMVYGHCNALTVDRSNAVWLAGYLAGGGDYNPYPFVWKVSPSQKVLETDSATLNTMGELITHDYSNNIYVAGSFNEKQTFSNTTLYASGGNYFIAKINASQTDTSGILTALNKDDVVNTPAVFPNPFESGFTLNMKYAVFDSYKVINAFNQVIQTGAINHNYQNIDLTGAAPGVYFIQLEKNGMVTGLKKVMKVKG